MMSESITLKWGMSMNKRMWLVFGAIAVFFISIGSLNADNLTNKDQNDLSAKVDQNLADTAVLNLNEQSSDNYWYGGLYPYLNYYPYYYGYSGYYPYYLGYSYPYSYSYFPYTYATLLTPSMPAMRTNMPTGAPNAAGPDKAAGGGAPDAAAMPDKAGGGPDDAVIPDKAAPHGGPDRAMPRKHCGAHALKADKPDGNEQGAAMPADDEPEEKAPARK
jgi:hypothetical protein